MVNRYIDLRSKRNLKEKVKKQQSKAHKKEKCEDAQKRICGTRN